MSQCFLGRFRIIPRAELVRFAKSESARTQSGAGLHRSFLTTPSTSTPSGLGDALSVPPVFRRRISDFFQFSRGNLQTAGSAKIGGGSRKAARILFASDHDGRASQLSLVTFFHHARDRRPALRATKFARLVLGGGRTGTIFTPVSVCPSLYMSQFAKHITKILSMTGRTITTVRGRRRSRRPENVRPRRCARWVTDGMKKRDLAR